MIGTLPNKCVNVNVAPFQQNSKVVMRLSVQLAQQADEWRV